MTREIRDRIIERFMQNVNGRQPDTTGGNPRHDGGAGHWFERQMGITANADNRPDLWGFECKNATGSQTTFGDWMADYLIWRDEDMFPNLVGLTGNNLRTQQNTNKDEVFLRAFGTWRKTTDKGWERNGYYSWSGTPSPSHLTKGFNSFGQALIVNGNNSISIIYCYSKDERKDKSKLVPSKFQIENLRLFGWSEKWIKDKVENKFSVHGWFKCIMKKGIFSEIIFGKPIRIQNFLGWIKSGDVIFDTGMKERRPNGTDRFRNQWRASSKFWKSLAVETYPKS